MFEVKIIELDDEQRRQGTEDGLIFNSHGVTLYGLYDDGVLVGWYGIKRRGATAVMKCAFTYPEHRGKGYLRYMIGFRLDILRREGVRKVTANCTEASYGVHYAMGARLVRTYKNGIKQVEYNL